MAQILSYRPHFTGQMMALWCSAPTRRLPDSGIRVGGTQAPKRTTVFSRHGPGRNVLPVHAGKPLFSPGSGAR